jgi:hypothetical protein
LIELTAQYPSLTPVWTLINKVGIWHSNTAYITQRGYAKLWLLRRLKAFGANSSELLDIYCKQVRSILEYAAVVWHSGLTQQNTADIERVQKCALAIILGKGYISYSNALNTLGLKRLSSRREELSTQFAEKALKSKKYSSWFLPIKKGINTRSQTKRVKEANTRTKRLRKSPIPYLTHLLNSNPTKNQ